MLRLLLYIRFASVFIAFVGLSHPALAGRTGSVTGLVTDTSNVALIGATVATGTKSVTTNSTGHYTLTAVSVGSQTITASKSLYTSGSAQVNVQNRSTVTAPTIKLAPNWGSVMGVVTVSGTATPIAGATISMTAVSTTAISDAAGQYTLQKVPTGSQTFTASAAGYATVSQIGSVPLGGTLALNFSLSPQNQITGPGSSIPWNGKNWYLSGNNYAWYNYGTDFGTGGWGKFTNWSQISTDFGNMRGQGVKVVRWWVFADGRYSPEWNGSGDTAVTGLDSQFFTDVDTALQIAHNNNIYLIPCLVDFHLWTSPVSSGGVTGGGHYGIIANAAIQQSYLDNALKPFLQHVAASTYKNNVIGYDIVNEPEWTIKEIWNGAMPLVQVQTFAQNCANYIHMYGGGAYATLGAGTPVWAKYWKGLGLDFYQIHYYPNYDNYNGNGTAGSGLPTYASLSLDKPCIVGEYATADVNYTFGSTQPLSAQWYLDTIYNYGYAGALGWGYQNMDSSSNWAAFQPVYTNWANLHSVYIGPQ